MIPECISSTELFPEFHTPVAICPLWITNIRFINKLCWLLLSPLPLESALTRMFLACLSQYKLVYLDSLPQHKCQALAVNWERNTKGGKRKLRASVGLSPLNFPLSSKAGAYSKVTPPFNPSPPPAPKSWNTNAEIVKRWPDAISRTLTRYYKHSRIGDIFRWCIGTWHHVKAPHALTHLILISTPRWVLIIVTFSDGFRQE